MLSESEPIVPQAIWEWLLRLHTATVGSSDAREAETRVGLVAPMIVSRFPPDAFNRQSFEHVAAGCRFWPAYGELVALLGEWWRDNRAGRSLLVPYAGPSHIPEGRAPPDEAEKAAVRAMVAGLVAELRAGAAAREGPPPPPLPDVTLKAMALRRPRDAAQAVEPAGSAAATETEPEE